MFAGRYEVDDVEQAKGVTVVHHRLPISLIDLPALGGDDSGNAIDAVLLDPNSLSNWIHIGVLDGIQGHVAGPDLVDYDAKGLVGGPD